MTVAVRHISRAVFQRERAMGLLFALLGLAIIALFGPSAEPGQQATFVLNFGQAGKTTPIADLVLPVRGTIYLLGLLALFLAGFQLVRAFKATNLILGRSSFSPSSPS